MEYLVNVAVHGVSALSYGIKDYSHLPNPYVTVTVFEDARSTHYLETTASGSFSYIFTYNKHMKPQDFAGEDAKIEVWSSDTLSSTMLGQVVFSLKQVWVQPSKTVQKEWVPICVKEAPGDIRGYVQLTVGAYGPGDIIPRMGGGSTDETDDDGGVSLRSRLVQPPTTSEAKSMYQLMVRVHQAEGIRQLPSTFSTAFPDPIVHVSFNGTDQETKVQSGSITPIWNEEARVPFTMPCWDDTVNVVLYSSGGFTGSDQELGEVALHICELNEHPLPPTWYNFYYSPEEEESQGIFVSGDEQLASAFAGRLLVSASVERADNPVFGISPTSSVNPPTKTKCTLWLDIYELVFDSAELPGFVQVTVSMFSLDDDIVFGEPQKHAHAFVFEGVEVGRRQATGIQLPPVGMAADMFIYVDTKPEDGLLLGGSFERFMFAHIKVQDIWHWKQEPDWYEMKLCIKEGKHSTGGFALMNINIGPDNTVPRRDAWKDLELHDYMFRAHIYQAVNLPCKDDAGTCDPKIIIFFGSAMVRSSMMPQSVCPMWHESYEEIVELPMNPDLRPDIFIYLVDMDDDGTFEALAQHKYETSADSLPEKWDKKPVWLSLDQVADGPETQGKILVAFELLPLDPSPEPLIPLHPEDIDCRIEIFVIGIRMYHGHQDISAPSIELSWGRQEGEDRAEPAKLAALDNPEGEKGNYNFLQSVYLKRVPLAQDALHQEYLELRLSSQEDDGTEEGHMKAVAFGAVHITPMLPWLTPSEAHSVRSQFKPQTYEQLKLAREKAQAVIPAADSKPAAPSGAPTPGGAGGGLAKKKGKIWKRVGEGMLGHGGMNPLEHRLCTAIGWNFPSIEDSNFTTIDRKECVSITPEDAQKNQKALFDIKAAWKATKRAAAAEEEAAKAKKKAQKLNLKVGGAVKASVVAKSDAKSVANDAIENFYADFVWPIYQDDGDDALHKHPVYNHELEGHELGEEGLPYETTSLFVGSPWGEQITIGTMKFAIRIVKESVRKEADADYEEAQAAWKKKLEELKARFLAAKSVAVRAYLLSADGLIPKSGRSDPNTYLWSRDTEDDDNRKNCDNGTVREHTLHPEFFKVHIFDKCDLPQNCLLEFKVIEQVPSMLGGTSEEIEVGNTVLDIEDRFFHDQYQKWFDDDVVPIEARALRTENSMFNHGHLRMILEVMTTDQANAKPLTMLPSSDPRMFQLRIVIWKANNIVCEGDASPDVYIIGKHTMDDGTILSQQTDVHYSCDDEIATWNWRWLFDVKIPCQDPRVQLVMWDYNVVTSAEPIAECTLDFSRDFLNAKKKNEIIEFPRGTLPMMHPSYPGEVRAWLDIEGVLMPIDEAMMNPVGEGREEPNQDPFVDGEDAHLVEHRGMIGNLDVVKNIRAVGGMLFAGFGIMAVLYVVVAAIGGIISLGLTVYMLTKE